MKEALRLHPAVALPLERVVPLGGLKVAGYHIPENTIVGINAWVIHYDSGVFGPDQHSFRPERWESTRSTDHNELLKTMERNFMAVSYTHSHRRLFSD